VLHPGARTGQTLRRLTACANRLSCPDGADASRVACAARRARRDRDLWRFGRWEIVVEDRQLAGIAAARKSKKRGVAACGAEAAEAGAELHAIAGAWASAARVLEGPPHCPATRALV